MPTVFLSYQTDDRLVAAELQNMLLRLGIDSFMAHENIGVSEEWRRAILNALADMRVFVAVLSERYAASAFCIQEAGIAVMRENEISIVPLSIDRTVSPGFMQHIQSRRVTPGTVSEELLLAGMATRQSDLVLNSLIARFTRSNDFRGAERNFLSMRPFLAHAEDKHYKAILEAAVGNQQIRHASLCAARYLPPILGRYGNLISEDDQRILEDTFSDYRE